MFSDKRRVKKMILILSRLDLISSTNQQRLKTWVNKSIVIQQ